MLLLVFDYKLFIVFLGDICVYKNSDLQATTDPPIYWSSGTSLEPAYLQVQAHQEYLDTHIVNGSTEENLPSSKEVNQH